jgi:hypothetical protein
MLVAAANWQVTAIQSAADSIFKLLIAVPTVGGAVFLALMIGAEPEGLLSMDARDLLTTIVGALLSQPLVLAAFGLSLAVVMGGGSAFMFLVKGGTIATLVESERLPVPVPEHDDPHDPLAHMAAAATFGVDSFFTDCRRFFPRYTRLGLLLVAVYVISASLFLAAGVAIAGAGGLTAGAVLSAGFVVWITVINLIYLLAQIVIVAEDRQVLDALQQIVRAGRTEWRSVMSIFVVVLGFVAVGTVVSIVAMGALGLIGFVPLFGLTVLPLQVAAWLFRALVFQFIELSAVGAYATCFRAARESAAPANAPLPAPAPADVPAAP